MKKLLIITQDTVNIQAYTGIIGQNFSAFYLMWLKLRLRLITGCLKPFFHLTLLCSGANRVPVPENYLYDQELAKFDFSANRKFYWQIVNNLLKELADPAISALLGIKLVSYLTYHYFVYFDLYEKIIAQVKPELVLVLGNSYHEQMAVFAAKKNHCRCHNLSFLSLSWLSNWISNILLKQEYQAKIKLFLSQSKFETPSLKSLSKASLLSLDFYRHLKILAPIYDHLQTLDKNPWLITDISNPESRFKNINLKNPHYCYLASFLPQNFRQKLKPLPQIKVTDFYSKLSLAAAQPMIKSGWLLTQLYLLAGENLFSQVQLKNIIVLFDTRFLETTLSFLAKRHRVRSIMTSPNPVFDLATLNSYDITDKLTVVGKHIKNRLIKHGVKQNKIFSVGDFRFSGYGQYLLPLNRQRIYQQLGISDLNKKIILVISFRPNNQLPQSEKQNFLRTCYQAVKTFPDAVLVVKPHPTESYQKLKQELLALDMGEVIVSHNQQLELMDLLSVAKAIVETWSMTIFESILMNCPVISLNLSAKDYGNFLPILKLGAAVTVRSKPELIDSLKTFLFDPKATRQWQQQAQRVNEQFIDAPDGQALQRLVKLLA